MKNTIIAVITIFTALLLTSLIGFYQAIRPIRITSNVTPNTYQLKYENISLKSFDGTRLSGWFIPAKNPNAETIILLHGYPADKGNILPITLFLHHQYNLFYLDFRYFGESAGNYTTIGNDEVKDVLAAIAYLKNKKHIHTVGIWGFSLGGAVAIMTAEQSPEVKAVVSISGFARLDLLLQEYYAIPIVRYPLIKLTEFWTWLFLRININDISPATKAEKLTIPILIIHSHNDPVIHFEHAKILLTALSNNPNVKSIIDDTNKHGELPKNYRDAILDFFANAFKLNNNQNHGPQLPYTF